MSGGSRDAILRRRAQFVGAALALAGCRREEAVKANAVPTSELAEEGSGKAAAPPRPPPPVKPPPGRPTLEAKVSVAAEAKRAAAAARIEKTEKGVAELAGAIPAGCPLGDPVCRARFEVFAEEVARLREEIYALHPPGCPPKWPDDKAIDRMVLDNRAWLGQWLDDVEKAGRASAEAHADAGSAWDDLQADAAKAYAHPCLSFACP